VAYNVVLDGQPFVVTGDTSFTAVSLGGGAESVQVCLSVLSLGLLFA
jgi:hypothetical protein